MTGVVCIALALLWVFMSAAMSWAGNAVAVENALPGDSHWYRPSAAESSVDIYASRSSLAPGETLQLHASVGASTRYDILIYRLGWYQGAGARLIGCVPTCGSDRAGSEYGVPTPDSSTGFLDAGWPVTDTFQIPATAVSGYYLAEALVTSGAEKGKARFYPFVVPVPAGHTPSSILVQIGINTAEAYNAWGGKSLYAFNSTGEKPAVKVSFNRPFLDLRASSQAMDVYQLIRFVERAGYDVSYTTDLDTDSNPGELRRHRLVIVDGHDEYWTKGVFDAIDRARETGVNLASFGADIGTWQSRYEDNGRTMVEYRSAAADPETDPTLKTVEFQKLATPRRQCELFGVEYRGGFAKYLPAPHLAQNYTVTQAASTNAWFAGTGLASGTVLPSLVGYEWDTIAPGCNVPPPAPLFHWAGFVDADSTTYTASSGARVFASGSLDFATGLDEWPAHGSGVENGGLQRFVMNLLNDLGGMGPATPEQVLPGINPPSPTELVEPQITALRISPARFRAAHHGAVVARQSTSVGARVTYVDSVAGDSTFMIFRFTRCGGGSYHAHARSCQRKVFVTRFGRLDSPGINSFRLTGRVRRRRLAPGRYLLTAAPASTLGARGGTSARFQIIR
jgi:hypothetical protein